jgi:glycosyltransferase involved in cell wall biosynthesis
VNHPLISIIIPCYNEVQTIEKLLDAVRDAPVERKQIIVVDDASTDGTSELLRDILRERVDILIRHEKNRGKGAALRSGMAAATGEYPRLIKPIVNGKADVVYGSRFLGHDPRRVLYFWHYVGNRFLTLLSNMFTNLNLSDMETCYKVFRREIVHGIKLEEDRFGFEPEVTAKIARIEGIRIYEVGISYYGRTYIEGKKIGWYDGVRAIYCVLKYGLLRR